MACARVRTGNLHGTERNEEFPAEAAGPLSVAEDVVKRRIAALRVAMLEAISAEDMANVTRMLVLHASCGDLRAMRILFPYVVGKPTPLNRQQASGPKVEKTTPAPTPEQSGERVSKSSTSVNGGTKIRAAAFTGRDPVAEQIDAGCTLLASFEARQRLAETLRPELPGRATS